MQIGELFVSLKVKGQESVQGVLKNVSKGMGDLGSTSLATKASIIGALYALEEMTRASNAMGTNLSQFHAFSGQNVEMLQRYQYAGRQVGATNEEIAGSFNNLVSAMAKLETTGQMPAGMTLIGQYLGDLDVNKALHDTRYLFDELAKFARDARVPVGVANEALLSFGLSPGTIAAMRKNAFRPDILSRAPVYSEKDAEALTKMNAQWGNLFQNWEMMVGRLNLKHGGALIRDLTKLSKAFEGLANSLLAATEKLHVFEGIGAVFKEITTDVSVLTGFLELFTGKITAKDLGDRFAKMEKEGNAPWLYRLFQSAPGALENGARGILDKALGQPVPLPAMTYGQNFGPPSPATNHYHIQSQDPVGVRREIERHEQRKNNNTARQSASGQMVKR